MSVLHRLISFTLLVLLAACAAPPSRSAERDGAGATQPQVSAPKRVTVGIRGTAQVLANKLNIANAGLGVAEIEKLVGAGLAMEDERGVLQPQLAEALPTLENGRWQLFPDGRMETRWTIRPGAVWHDGVAVTTEDLLFTATVVQDREVPVLRDKAFDSVERLEALDSRILVATWKRTFVEADALFSSYGNQASQFVPPLPRHLLEAPYLADRANFAQHPYWSIEFIGAGPYKVREYVRDSYLILDANERYVLGRPKIDQIEARFIPDANTLIANILAGTIDLTFDSRSITFAQALQMKDQWRDGAISFDRSTWVTMFPQFLNPTPAAVADLRFRRALLQAIDRQDIVDTMQSGVGGVAHHYVAPDWPEYKELEQSIVRYDYDVRRAAQLLEEIGFNRGGDGTFRDPASQRFTVEIRTTGVDINSKSSSIVADHWQRLGVTTEVAIVAPQRTNDREYRSTFPSFELIRPTTTLKSFENLHGAEAQTPESNWAGSNRGRYRNAELDSLIDRYGTTIPRTERMAIVAAIVHHMTDQLPQLGIVYDPIIRLIANRLQRVPAGTPWNAQEWDVS